MSSAASCRRSLNDTFEFFRGTVYLSAYLPNVWLILVLFRDVSIAKEEEDVAQI